MMAALATEAAREQEGEGVSLTTDDLAKMIEGLQQQVADLAQTVGTRRAIVGATEAVAVSAAEAAAILRTKPHVVYQFHKDGTLNGFRYKEGSDLRFLVSEVRDLARVMSVTRRNA